MGQVDKAVLHMEIDKSAVVRGMDWHNRGGCNNSRGEEQHKDMQQMDIEDSSEREEQEQWVEELGERGTSTLDSGVEKEEFVPVREPAAEAALRPAVVTAAAAVAAAAAVVPAAVAAVAVAEIVVVVVAEVVDTGTVGTSTLLHGVLPMTRIGDCVINLLRGKSTAVIPFLSEYLFSRHCKSISNKTRPPPNMSSPISIASSEHLRRVSYF